MKKIILMCLLVLFGCKDSDKASSTNTSYQAKENKPKVNTDRDKIAELESQDCAEFIALISAKDLAIEFGWTEAYVLKNHRVNVWAKTTANGKGKPVGEMHPGSNALILEKKGNDFKIVSPLDNSIGWVNNVQVDRTHYQNPKTYEACE